MVPLVDPVLVALLGLELAFVCSPPLVDEPTEVSSLSLRGLEPRLDRRPSLRASVR